MKKLLLVVIAVFVLKLCHATTLIVVNTNDSGAGSFRDAVANAIDGDTIRFNPAILASGNDTIKLASYIFIGKNLVVKGLFTATDTLFISGQNTNFILSLGFAQSFVGTRNIVLDSLAFVDGNHGTSQGGGLYVGSYLDTLFIQNSLIRNCQAENGAGIFCATPAASTQLPPLVVLENTIVENNAANNFGGGICTYFAKIKTINCKISGNTAERGGGIYFHSKYVSEVLFTEVRNNSATAYGGGFYAHFTDTVYVSNSYFYGNYAFYNGGAMNSAGKLDINKTHVDSNSAGTRAGGVYFAYFGTLMTVDSSLFTRNDATFGGAVNAQSAMNFNYTTFDNNTGSQGPGLYFTSATVNVLGCTFSNNVGSTGGGINVGQNASIVINKSTIVNNTATGLGGGIYCYNVYNAGTFSISNSTVSGNSAPFGGGVYFRTSSIYPLNATFKSSIVAGNGPLNIRAFNDTITSLGYNVFGDTTVVNSVATDQIFVSDSALSLRVLGDYGGFTQTAPPNKGSVAINAGNPLDASSAQNKAIVGVRDAGAAELLGVYHDTMTACTQVDWYGTTYSASGNYVNLLPNSDTVATLNLTIVPFTTGVDVISSCTAYTWIDSITYTSSNFSATDTLVNSIGCDSIVTLNLTIFPPTSGTDVISSCDPIIWIDGITYTSNTNSDTDTLVNAFGCDSIVTLNLTILASSSGTDQILACGNYTWIDGITYTSNNNTATDTLVNAVSCDSIVTLDLTVHITNVSVSVTEPSITANASFASYQWLDCNNNFAVIPGENAQVFTATANGRYAVQITELGCVDTSECTSISTIGLADIVSNAVLVYPNPACEVLQIANLWPGQEKRIALVNALGQKVFVLETSLTEVQIDLRELSAGSYMLQMTSENESLSEQVLVAK